MIIVKGIRDNDSVDIIIVSRMNDKKKLNLSSYKSSLIAQVIFILFFDFWFWSISLRFYIFIGNDILEGILAI